MTRHLRRNHSPAFKSKVALAALRGDKTLSELSTDFGIHVNLIRQWKEQLVAGSATIFGPGTKPSGSEQAVDLKTLYARIGELSLENDFLSTALGKAGLLPSAKR